MSVFFQLICISIIGFSLICAPLLFVIYVVFIEGVNKGWLAILSCAVLLLSLVSLQIYHLDYFLGGDELLVQEGYLFWLFVVPGSFYFFCRSILLPEAKLQPLLLLHLCPLGLMFIPQTEIATACIFLVGAAYSIWFVHILTGLKSHTKPYKIELFFMLASSVAGVGVIILGFSIPYIENHYFYLFYSSCIGVAFVLIVAVMIAYPDLLNNIVEAANISYASSTLVDIDIEEKAQALSSLMKDQKFYQNELLSLTLVADQLGLSSHQLSELINTQYRVGFSRYIRELRVDEAKRLLEAEPNASILAISIESGFKSQSSFYAAFKEITDVSPGAYRKSLGV